MNAVEGDDGESTPAPVRSAAGVHVVPEAEWDDLVGSLGRADTYVRRSYHRASALLEPSGTQPVLLHLTDLDCALPLLLRPLPDGSGWDATSAYGYGGPVGSSPPEPGELRSALDRWARENRVVSTFLRLHPLLGNAALLAGSDDLIDAGVTFAWDVGPDRPLMAAMHAHHRRAARRAEREGLVVTVAERPAGLEEFRELYATTMQRQRAEPFYFFPDAYWDALCADRDPLGLVLVEGRLAGQLVAALLCFRNGPWLHYHLGASAEAGRDIGASNRCFLEAAEWAQAMGVTRFHLGGGVGGGRDSSLAVFKSRFDPAAEPLPFHVAKLVHDPDRYAALAGTGSTEGFFPPWRRGLPA